MVLNRCDFRYTVLLIKFRTHSRLERAGIVFSKENHKELLQNTTKNEIGFLSGKPISFFRWGYEHLSGQRRHLTYFIIWLCVNKKRAAISCNAYFGAPSVGALRKCSCGAFLATSPRETNTSVRAKCESVPKGMVQQKSRNIRCGFFAAPSGTLPRAKERRTVAFLTALACRRPVLVTRWCTRLNLL